jgi:predicted dehydrogenase
MSARTQKRFWRTDVEDFCWAQLRCGQVDVSLRVSLTSWQNHFSIDAYGSEGCVSVRGRGGNYGEQRLDFVNRWFWNGDDRRLTREYGIDDISFESETAAFLAAVAGGSTDFRLSDSDDGVAALTVVKSLYEAAGAGQGSD